MTNYFVGIMVIIAIVVWIVASQELMKSSKEQDGRKIVLLSAGTLLTLILTIS